MSKICGCGERTKKSAEIRTKVGNMLSRLLPVFHRSEKTELCEKQGRMDDNESICEMIKNNMENPADRIEPWRCMYCGHQNPKGVLWCRECGYLGGIKD